MPIYCLRALQTEAERFLCSVGIPGGRRPTRESLIGNGGGAPPVSRFLYRPAL